MIDDLRVVYYLFNQAGPIARWRMVGAVRSAAIRSAYHRRDWRMIAHLAATWPGFLWRGLLLMTENFNIKY